jgi:hypothetical protein
MSRDSGALGASATDRDRELQTTDVTIRFVPTTDKLAPGGVTPLTGRSHLFGRHLSHGAA